MENIFERYIQKGLIALILASLIAGPYGFSEEETPAKGLSLSIEGAVKMALENNRDVAIGRNEVKAAEAKFLGAFAEFLPEGGLVGGYTYRDAVVQAGPAFPKSATEGKDLGVFLGYNNENTFGVSVQETLFNGGANIAAYKQAKLQVKSAKEALRAIELAVEFEAKRLYYGLILAGETKRIAVDLVDQAKAHYADVQKKNDNGTASRFELLQSKVQVSKVEPQLVRARSSEQLIEAELNKLLGLSVNNRIIPVEKLDYSELVVDEELFLKEARIHRPELIMRALGIDISKQSIAIARAASLPQVSGNFDYLYKTSNPQNMIDPQHSNWNMGVAVSVPIFDGFRANAKVNEARAKYSEAVVSRDDLNEQVAVEIRKGCLDIAEADSIILSQKGSIEEAREALKISQVSYDSGVATNLDVLDSQVSLSQVEENLSEAIYDHIMAKAYLDKAMGKSSLREDKNDERNRGYRVQGSGNRDKGEAEKE